MPSQPSASTEFAGTLSAHISNHGAERGRTREHTHVTEVVCAAVGARAACGALGAAAALERVGGHSGSEEREREEGELGSVHVRGGGESERGATRGYAAFLSARPRFSSHISGRPLAPENTPISTHVFDDGAHASPRGPPQ
jgi:hypothetical protein